MSRAERGGVDTSRCKGIDMDYLHFIRISKDFDPLTFAAAVEDVRTLFRRTEATVAGPKGIPALCRFWKPVA